MPLLPLDDDVIDLLIERSPRFRADCLEIRERMDFWPVPDP